jgi:hypothetical protein
MDNSPRGSSHRKGANGQYVLESERAKGATQVLAPGNVGGPYRLRYYGKRAEGTTRFLAPRERGWPFRRPRSAMAFPA